MGVGPESVLGGVVVVDDVSDGKCGGIFVGACGVVGGYGDDGVIGQLLLGVLLLLLLSAAVCSCSTSSWMTPIPSLVAWLLFVLYSSSPRTCIILPLLINISLEAPP